jgi:excisionase family DNA binding protein
LDVLFKNFRAVSNIPASRGGIRQSRGVAQYPAGVASEIEWLSTAEAARRLGITPRTLYRFLDEGQLPGFRFGRVIRLKATDVEEFIEACRIEPGTLEHLYPEPSPASTSASDEDDT